MTTNHACRLVATVLTIALLAVSTTIWRSPQARSLAGKAVAAASLPHMLDRVRTERPQPRPASATNAQEPKTKATPTAEPRTAAPSRPGNEQPATTASTRSASAGAPVAQRPQKSTAFNRASTRTTGQPRALHCWSFRWQQDAQRAYVANLRDPWGLDGAPGPRNDDGIACTALRVDPRRPPSAPAAPYVEPLPVAPPKAALLRPAKRYFGVFTRQAPFVMSEVDQIGAATGKAPNSVTFFAGWDQPFRADAIVNAWRRRMLPIVTWESRPHNTAMTPGSDNAVDSKYQLSRIIAGDFDAYLDKWAAGVKKLGLPIGLRFDHEMNGSWYPWSEQANGNKPGEFVRAWRHVHDRFTAVGATNVIWVWSPNVIGSLKDIDLAELYPGSDYVDWLGLGGYYRKPIPGKPATFDNTFAESLTALRAIDDKPILLTEIGCTETGGNKPAWIRSLFEALPQQPDIIGFSWFNQTVTAIPIGQTLPVTNDWRIDSTPQALAAFRAGIADPRYGSGKQG
jgi:mannan endo-1,4-beta-mannosidase